MAVPLHIGLLALSLSPLQASGELNDTGITACYSNSATPAGSVSPQTPDPAPSDFPGQDCTRGRSAADAMGALRKTGASSIAGRDYTKVSRAGNDLPIDALPGTGTSDWGCIRDNVTGLLWEIKTDDGGLQDKDHSYGWYDPDPSTNGGVAGRATVPEQQPCGATLPSGLCTTFHYRQAINALALCGRSDWQLPTYTDVIGLVDFTSHVGFSWAGGFDTAYFPGLTNAVYFTRDSRPSDPRLAGLVVPGSGLPSPVRKDLPGNFRQLFLVAGSQS